MRVLTVTSVLVSIQTVTKATAALVRADGVGTDLRAAISVLSALINVCTKQHTHTHTHNHAVHFSTLTVCTRSLHVRYIKHHDLSTGFKMNIT